LFEDKRSLERTACKYKTKLVRIYFRIHLNISRTIFNRSDLLCSLPNTHQIVVDRQRSIPFAPWGMKAPHMATAYRTMSMLISVQGNVQASTAAKCQCPIKVNVVMRSPWCRYGACLASEMAAPVNTSTSVLSFESRRSLVCGAHSRGASQSFIRSSLFQACSGTPSSPVSKSNHSHVRYCSAQLPNGLSVPIGQVLQEKALTLPFVGRSSTRFPDYTIPQRDVQFSLQAPVRQTPFLADTSV